MARKQNKTPTLSQYRKNEMAIAEAKRWITNSPLGALLSLVQIELCQGLPDDPKMGAVDPINRVIYLNPYFDPKRKISPQQSDFSWGGWTDALAHLLLHLGLNHAARREDREPLIWNAACDVAINHLIGLFGFTGSKLFTLEDYEISDRTIASEEAIYDAIQEARAVYRSRADIVTYAGGNRPDILGMNRLQSYDSVFEAKLAEAIRMSVQMALQETAEKLNEDAEQQSKVWPPVARAKRWIMTELPLLGALAAEIRVFADAKLCERMDIPVAAVNGFLGEMYLNTDCHSTFTDAEVLFVYAHELLHVALFHHTRCAGRDPEIWNWACDFVINSWLVEMGVGQLPKIGGLYDPRLAGMSAEQVYDLLVQDRKRCKGLRGFRGGLGDILMDKGYRIYRGDVTTLDDVYRRCLAAGLSCQGMGRGLVPAGLVEEIKSLFTPPVPWDVELGKWMEQHIPSPDEFRRSYARASRRQASTPEIPRPATYIPQEVLDACTFGVVLDTSGSMDRQLLGRALGAIASYAEARDVPAVRLVMCDARPYDRGFLASTELRGQFPIMGRGGTVLQPAVAYLTSRPDFPTTAPIMILTDGYCEEEILCAREHCFLLPRKRWQEGAVSLRTSAPVFRVLKEDHEP